MHMGGYNFVSSCMHNGSPPICPLKGCVLLSLVSQSLALESSTSQNLTMTNTLDYALHHPHLDNNRHALVSLFHSHCSHHISTRRIIFTMPLDLSTTNHRLLSSGKQKNHKCCRMTGDTTLVFSSCPNNTPMIGLCQFWGTKGQDLIRVFYVTALPRIIESALAPYPYPGFCNT